LCIFSLDFYCFRLLGSIYVVIFLYIAEKHIYQLYLIMINISEIKDFESEVILVRKYIGVVSTEEIIASWDDIFSNELINERCKGVIDDLTKCKLNMNMQSFQQLLKYLKQNRILKNIKHAVVSDTPEVIVFPTIAQKMDNDISICPFTTVDAAVDWILNR